MAYSTSIWHILVLIGGIQGLILSLVLLVRSRKRDDPAPYRLLSILILSVSIDMVFTYLSISGISARFPSILFISDPLYTLSGCLLYLFVQALLSKRFVFKTRYLFFFIPFFIEVGFFIVSSRAPQENLHTLYNLTSGGPQAIDYAFFWALELVFNLGMTGAAACALRRYTLRLKDHVTEIGKFSLRWLRNFILLALVFFTLQVVFLLLFISGISSIATAFIYSYVLMAVCFYLMSYWALSDPVVYVPATIERKDITAKSTTGKYQKNPLHSKQVESIASDLLQIMEEERLYLTNGIKLDDIARRLSTSPNTVSQIINQHLKMNFYDFINRYRVDEAKRLMHDPAQRDLTLLAIAMNAGFSSKSTFNKVFKEYTDSTPSQYYRSITPQSDQIPSGT
jgi:AraC-like DNA-binding protein